MISLVVVLQQSTLSSYPLNRTFALSHLSSHRYRVDPILILKLSIPAFQRRSDRNDPRSRSLAIRIFVFQHCPSFPLVFRPSSQSLPHRPYTHFEALLQRFPSVPSSPSSMQPFSRYPHFIESISTNHRISRRPFIISYSSLTTPTLHALMTGDSHDLSILEMWGTSHRWPGKQGFYDFPLTTFLWLITYLLLTTT